jgi:hypothetical protein
VCLAASALAGCSDDGDEPESEPSETVATTPPAYDPTLEPAAAVLPLVPDDATRLTVTDYDQIRLQLGNPDLTGDIPDRQREKFWARVGTETAALSDGLLRDDDEELRADYGFSQDDVEWEAHFGGEDGETGWVLKFRDDLGMDGVQRAVDDGVGPLGDAKVAVEERVIGVGTTSDMAASWAADEAITPLVGRPASATYAERGCIPFADVYGEDVLDELASGPSADVADLAELPAFTVSFGGELATARLGDARSDTFDRSRLADTLPETDPSFGDGFRQPVADPSTGRIGYTLGDPRVAVDLTLSRRLPFAVCAS